LSHFASPKFIHMSLLLLTYFETGSLSVAQAGKDASCVEMRPQHNVTNSQMTCYKGTEKGDIFTCPPYLNKAIYISHRSCSCCGLL
jgi:hypothetical protein